MTEVRTAKRYLTEQLPKKISEWRLQVANQMLSQADTAMIGIREHARELYRQQRERERQQRMSIFHMIAKFVVTAVVAIATAAAGEAISSTS